MGDKGGREANSGGVCLSLSQREGRGRQTPPSVSPLWPLCRGITKLVGDRDLKGEGVCECLSWSDSLKHS